MSISNAISEFLRRNNIVSRIKWPNDICIGREKIAGILIENAIVKDRFRYSVIGIGLNVNQHIFPEDLVHATSMCNVTGIEFGIDHLLHTLLQEITHWIQHLYNRQYGNIKNFYLNNLQYMNEWRSYKDKSGFFEGMIVDVSESGELMVRKKTGEIYHYAFKEIIPDL